MMSSLHGHSTQATTLTRLQQEKYGLESTFRVRVNRSKDTKSACEVLTAMQIRILGLRLTGGVTPLVELMPEMSDMSPTDIDPMQEESGSDDLICEYPRLQP